jgi:hypothetical protein
MVTLINMCKSLKANYVLLLYEKIEKGHRRRNLRDYVSFRYFDQNFLCISHIFHTCYVLASSRPP